MSPRVTPALGEMEDGFAAVRVFYATDRKQTEANLLPRFFDASRTRELKYGWCEVTIPAAHQMGRIESPGLLGRPSPQNHVMVREITAPMDHDLALKELTERVSRSPRREVLVFIHGFAVEFDEAAQRIAQIAHDIEFDGVAMLYSWPAQGSILSYFVDATNAEWSTYYLTQFLDDLVQHSGAERIHLFAHSMGTRVLVTAIRNYLARHGVCGDAAAIQNGDLGLGSGGVAEKPPFDQIILAAADMDAQIFERDHAPLLALAGRRITVYVSGADWALGGAQRLHRYSRLGQGSLTHVDLKLLVDKLDVIDVTRKDRGLIGHFYYGQSPDVLRDVAEVLQGTTPSDRGLTREFFYQFGN